VELKSAFHLHLFGFRGSRDISPLDQEPTMADNSTKPIKEEEVDLNRDPLSGEPGAHPVGTGVGAAAAGAAGMAVGSAAGPVGAAVGAVVGAVAGGLAGKGVAESIDPTVEEAYWRDNFHTRPYAAPESSFEEYRPAYRYGWESRSHYPDRTWDEVETDLRTGWEKTEHNARLGWAKAKHATRDAWDRVTHPRTSTTDRTTP
jgi:hypothetical protein